MSSTDFKSLAREMSGREGSRNSVVLIVVVLLIAMTVTWAYLTELDNVTRGEGRIVSAMQNQVIQAAEGGVILTRNVSEGSTVRKDDILFEIDPIDASSEYNRALQRQIGLTVKEARLRAEIAGEEPKFSEMMRENAAAVVASEESLYVARRTELAGALAILQQRLLQREQELADAEISIQTLENTEALIAREIEIMEPLVQQSIAPETRLLELRREIERTRGSLQSSKTAVQRARAGITEVENEIKNRQDAYVLTSMEELSATVAELAELEEVLPSLEERVGRTVIRAPVDGIVNQLNFRTTGGYVNRGDAILELVPTGDELVIEAKINPADISNIRLDDLVRIRFSAYDSARYGSVDGRVLRISPDAVQDQNTGETHYLIDVAIEGTIKLDDGTDVVFMPGMTATVDVLSGKRTVLEYVWQPVAKVQELALRD